MADTATAAGNGRERSTIRPHACACRIPSTCRINPHWPPWRLSELRVALKARRAPNKLGAVRRIDTALAELLLLLPLADWLRLASGLG
jgi:hypothetical protein